MNASKLKRASKRKYFEVFRIPDGLKMADVPASDLSAAQFAADLFFNSLSWIVEVRAKGKSSLKRLKNE